MIRLTFALNFALLASLIGGSSAVGQQVTSPEPPGSYAAKAAEAQAATEASQAKAETSRVVSQPIDEQSVRRLRALQALHVAKVPDPLEVNFGLSLSDADDPLRAQLEIPAGEGVVVVGVKAGSLAEHAGLKGNDVLLSLGGQKTKGVEEVRKALLGLGKEAIEVKLIREGKARRMSLVGPEHGFPPEAAEFWIGTPVSPVDATLRAHLPTLSAETGLIINDVVKDSPADQAGLKKNDILVTMDAKPLKNADALIAQIQASKGKPVPLEVLRAGKPLSVTITPAKRTHPTVINSRRYLENQYRLQVVRPSMAIEVEPKQAGAKAKIVDEVVTPFTGNVSYTVTNLPAWSYRNPTESDPSAARIEAQLKEVVTKLDEITKALEALKKAAPK